MAAPASVDLRAFVRDIPDFPRPGVVFKDITPLLGSAAAFNETVDRLAEAGRGWNVNKVVAIESRGFIFGSAIAQALAVGVAPVRKKGKLPFKTLSEEYTLEYGTDTLEIHVDAVEKTDRVLVVDDVLATGGTARAVTRLVEKAGAAVVGLAFVIELEFLKGRDKLAGHPILSLLRY